MDNNLRKLDVVIIVPYRNRQSHLSTFLKVMPHILEDKRYEIVFVHQCDNRPFNRGAIKNIGLLYLKRYYPESYKDITMIFNDIDTLPKYKNQFSYNTIPGKVEHYYGYQFALGGIFAINAGDFEKINGFPNIWTWGLEDNILLKRCNNAGIKISRDNFVSVASKEKMIILDHGNIRYMSDYIANKYHNDIGTDGIRSLYNLKLNPVYINQNVTELQVNSFETGESLKSPFVRSAGNIDISKRAITFDKRAIIGGSKWKKTMLF
tara:strand:- start:20 stop:811 length:792 start_codon:yes stop_codon:yes gene_type:complete